MNDLSYLVVNLLAEKNVFASMQQRYALLMIR